VLCLPIQGCSESSGKSVPSVTEEKTVNDNADLFTVDAGEDQYHNENTEVSFKGLYPTDENIISFSWLQTSGDPVEILSKQTSTLKFITPELPNGTTTTTLTFEFTVINDKSVTATDNVSIFIKKEYSPLEANAGDDLIVESLSVVTLQGKTDENNSGIISRSWQQDSGPNITLSNPTNASISFTAPEVNQTEIIVLSYTVQDDTGLSSNDKIEITIIPKTPQISPHVLLFTADRISSIRKKIVVDSTAWNALTSKISNYYNKIPYNAGEYAGAFAIAYYISGETKYINRAIELLNDAYFDEPDIGWEYYKSRNLFRSHARWAVMGYSWIKDYISPQEQLRIENILKVWSEYWLLHVDYANDFKALWLEDTDDVTSITKNITLLGYVLSNSDIHSTFGEQMLNAGDALLERYVVGYYMKDIMKGGAWAEGSDYSSATQTHWITTFLINKDQRGIEYPENYAKVAMESLIHQTLAGDTGVYKYGSEESAVDYDDLSGDYRYELALSLMSILEDENDIALINQWFEKIITKEGFKSGSMVTHLDRLLFHDPTVAKAQPISNLNTLHYAEGVGLIAARDSWEDTATNLYFINRQIRVDHEHRDALSFDIAHNGVWITKEATGYGGVAELSPAHNTILIENASDGSSNPTRRPAGAPEYHSMYDDDYVTLISADATKTYNMSGYFATDYATQVNRQLAFIKPNVVIVYDHVITDENEVRDLTYYSDLNLTEDMKHTRWVKLIQHAQAEPMTIEGTLNSYQVENENRRLVYQVISPSNATINIVDEKELWKESLEYEVPENQRKWHFEVSTLTAKPENEFITTLSFGESDMVSVQQLLLEPQTMTKENSYIISGNITGLALQTQQGKFIILFKRDPSAIIDNARIKKPDGFENAFIYSIGFDIK
jgi:hypothetical protein